MAVQASLRSHMGFVPQDTVLFNDTILHNIRWAPASMPYPAYSSRTGCSQPHPRKWNACRLGAAQWPFQAQCTKRIVDVLMAL